MVRASTAASPNEGVTSGSLSVQQSGRALRHVCAEVRQIFLKLAADRLGSRSMPSRSRTARFPGPAMSDELLGLAADVRLDRDATVGVMPKPTVRRTLAGSSVQRIDIPDKVFARPRFIHDWVLPGMLHGRVLRPEGARATLLDLSEAGARAAPGFVAIVQDGSFAGVVSQTENGARSPSWRCARARHGPRARHCLTKTTSPAS